jgi:hypothetical protein
MDLINEAEIRDTWSPIIESATGITESAKLGWMSTYCHNHKLYEDANIMSLNPGMNLMGMGAASAPTGNGGNVGGSGTNGSGDKVPSLLPLAMQVAGQTIALDLVPVVPMAGPMGLLSYLDFTYQGGADGSTGADGTVSPIYVKLALTSGTAASVAASLGTLAANYAGYTYIGTSRIDGKHIFEALNNVQGTAANIAADITIALATDSQVVTGSSVELVKGLEDHIAGFSASNAAGDPYSREAGESTPDKLMGLTLYSKTVAAETFQAAAAVTREQVQDLKQFGVDAVAQVESVLVNELTQSINALILKKLRAHGDSNAGSVLDVTIGAASYGGSTAGSEHRRVLTQILAAANFIANKGRRGAGNFAVVSARLASAIQSVSGFVPNPIANTVSQVAGGIYPLGSVAGVNIYTDPNIAWGTGTTEDILVGRKGDGNGAGVVFMPYLMAESVQTIAEGTMAPKVAIKSRFALVDAGHHPETAYANFTVSGFVL